MRLGAVHIIIMCCVSVIVTSSLCSGSSNLVQNPEFFDHPDNLPSHYDITGNVLFRHLADDSHGGPFAVCFDSARPPTMPAPQGSISQLMTLATPNAQRWYRFAIRALPAKNFSVPDYGLLMKVEFFQAHQGFDGKIKRLYPLIQQQRQDFNTNGDYHNNGAATWHTYQLDVLLPSPQIDQVRLTLAFDHGNSPTTSYSQFLVSDFAFTPIDGPAPTPAATSTTTQEKPANLIPIGGRFFYQADPNETTLPKQFDYTNANRLLYHDSVWSAPFAGTTTAWLRAGDLDADGNLVTQDRLLQDNVTITFDKSSLIIHTHSIPNHPTGKFPGENPSYIQEKIRTYYIPLNPKENPHHVATDTHNVNHALNMGPIGIATNGVVFFNPFDANSTDASNIMDYCCGHPAPDNTYHYHKYPICINSPWADEGTDHSPLIGFAFDGFPIYGPYASANTLAKDVTGPYALNAFNLHTDADRGPHYQVTPGKFPYIIGGYWGTPDRRDIHMGPPGGGFGPQRGASPD